MNSHISLSQRFSPWSQNRNPFGNKRKTPVVVAPTSIDIHGKINNKNEAKKKQKRGTQLVRARVATERQKNGLRSKSDDIYVVLYTAHSNND